jgi:WD40 repeat protein
MVPPLATSGGHNGVRFWNVARRREIGHLINQPDDVHKVKFSPDGKTLAAADRNVDKALF